MLKGLLAILCLCLTLPLGAVRAQVAAPPELVAQMPQAPTGRLAHLLQRGTLIVGVKDDYPPWGMRDASGDIIGLEIDLARALAERMGVGLELVPVSATNRIGRVNQGTVDVVIATTADTVERRRQVDMIVPNYYSSAVVAYGPLASGVRGWDALRGEKVCLNRGAFFNRPLEQDFGIDGQYFATTRDSRLALQQDRCEGWAFDDTALAQLIRAERESAGAGFDPAYGVITEAILTSPWSIFVAKGEGQGDLGRFVSDMVAEWHASGTILALQDKWGIPRSEFVQNLNTVWSRVEEGRAVCARDAASGAYPAVCLQENPVQSVKVTPPPGWVDELYRITGIDLRAALTPYNQERLKKALGLTLSLSFLSIFGALTVGMVLASLNALLSSMGLIGRILLLPQQALVTVARMTPPILQLYIVFFGLGGILGNPSGFIPGAFAVAVIILSLYAGATNTIILNHAMEAEAAEGTPPMRRLPAAFTRGFDGLVATCVNIVKGAAMASAIAVSELVSTVDLLVSEGADTATMMNSLLVFYFLLVLFILWLFQIVRNRLERP